MHPMTCMQNDVCARGGPRKDWFGGGWGGGGGGVKTNGVKDK